MTDKTGTLTKNQLSLTALCADATVTYVSQKYSNHELRRQNSINSARTSSARQSLPGAIPPQQASDHLSLDEYMQDKTDFVKCILLCHECTKKTEGTDNERKEVLTGTNLDEQALINGLEEAKCGRFAARSPDSISIIMKDGDELVYDLIHTNEFCSSRKLMSVVVVDRRDGQAYVFAKGAESEIMTRLNQESWSGSLKAKVASEVKSFGNMGLRTLSFAMREMSSEELVRLTDWIRANDKKRI